MLGWFRHLNQPLYQLTMECTMSLTTEITMTSTEIAALTGKEKFNIHKDIKEQILKGLYGLEDASNCNDQQIQGLIIEFNDYENFVHVSDAE